MDKRKKSKLDVVTEQGDSATILRLVGEFDTNRFGILIPHVLNLVQKGQYKLALDMSIVNYLDSRGMGMLVALMALLRRVGMKFKIFNLSPDVQTILESTNLDKVLFIYRNEQEAVSSSWQREMELRITTKNNVVIIRIQGKYDNDSFSNLVNVVNKLIEDGHTKIAADLGDLEIIDSSGLGALVSVMATLQEKGFKFKIFNLQKQVQSIIRSTNLHKVLYIYVSEEDAIISSWLILPK